MNTEVTTTQTPKTASDRRQHPRYRFSAPITLHSDNGVVIPGMTLEISEGGLSALLASPLKVGEAVALEPIAGSRVPARVRHTLGKIYGFEFIELSEEQVQRIREDCQKLPLFQNRLGI